MLYASIKKRYIIWSVFFGLGQLGLLSTYIYLIIVLDFFFLIFVMYPILVTIFTFWFLIKLYRISKSFLHKKVKLTPNFKMMELPNLIENQITFGFPNFLFDLDTKPLKFYDQLDYYQHYQMFELVQYDKTYAKVKDSFDQYFITLTSNLEIV